MCGFEGMWKDNARVAQLVEYNLAKVGVAGSSPVSRFFLWCGSLDFTRVSAFFVSVFSVDSL